jgi:uncharacterized membrane protein
MSSPVRWRYGAALFWIAAGMMHFLKPRAYEAIVPPPVDRFRSQVVIASGVAELSGSLAVLPRKTRRFTRWWLLGTLLAVYPANVFMALKPERFPRIPRAVLWARLPLQGLFAWITWRGTK